MAHNTMSPYISLQSKPQMSYWKLGYHLWYEPRLGARSSLIRDCLARVSGSERIDPWIVRAGPPMWIKMPEHCVSPPYGVSMSPMTPSVPDRPIYPRCLTIQQPHKSNSSGHVKPLTPLLTRKKRMPSLRSVSRF